MTMSPSAAEVRRSQFEAELLVEGVRLCVPKDQGFKAAIQWTPDSASRVLAMMKFLIKHNLKFYFDNVDDEVELHIHRPAFPNAVFEVSESDYVVFDGTELLRMSSYDFQRSWEFV